MNELVRRIAITIGALLLFRLGSHIPLAGMSTQSGLLSSLSIDRVSIRTARTSTTASTPC